MADKNYYSVLDVPKTASQEEIKKAYRRLARQYHPDVNHDPDAEERFKEINEAYEILSDPQKRAMFDRFGTVSPNGMGGMGGFGGFRDPFDIFAEVFGNLGGFGFGTQGRAGPRRGQDLRTSVTITFEEAAAGVTKEVQVQRLETCQTCGGSGAEPGTKPERCPECGGKGQVRHVQRTFLGSFVNITTCPTCRGSGRIVRTPCHACNGAGKSRAQRNLSFHIPAGIDDGMSIRLSGEGEPGEQSGPAGNLYVGVRVKPHPYFKRRDDDVLMELQINVTQAALGATVTVPTLDGEQQLTIPAGTQPSTIRRLRGLGIPRLRGNGRGDQLVIIQVAVPTQLTCEQRELLQTLSHTLGTESVVEEKQGVMDRIKEALGL
ncbi:MAG: molecular chaperone DnaJ [Anaerolineae bacterium]|nr:molecular chaperone DnaJ [Anaerolineae bacterium]